MLNIFSFFLFLNFGFSQDSNSELIVQIENINNTKGSIRICLANEKNDFLKNCFQSKIVEIPKRKKLNLVFKNIPKGKYAISLYHDENNNGELDMNFLGIPTEDYGFSNKPMILFGPPSFEDVSFNVNKKITKLTIKL